MSCSYINASLPRASFPVSSSILREAAAAAGAAAAIGGDDDEVQEEQEEERPCERRPWQDREASEASWR